MAGRYVRSRLARLIEGGGNKFLGACGLQRYDAYGNFSLRLITRKQRKRDTPESTRDSRLCEGALIVEKTFGCRLILCAEGVVCGDNGGGRRWWRLETQLLSKWTVQCPNSVSMHIYGSKGTQTTRTTGIAMQGKDTDPLLYRQLLTHATASQEEMKAHRIPLGSRDSCAHLLIPLNQCRRREFYLPWKCENER